MYQIRHRNKRGKTILSWLDSSHTFSFAGYTDENYMGFSDLRVINEDYMTPGHGFELHSHSNMEIISIVLEGTLEHKDNMGNKEQLRRGEIQTMTAGTGVYHSEYNPSETETTHFLQIWILTDKNNADPDYAQKKFNAEEEPNKLHLIVSEYGEENSLTINQDAKVYQGIIEIGKNIYFEAHKNREYWIQIAEGTVKIKDKVLEAGDGLAISEEEENLSIEGIATKSNLLIFDLRKI